jgi:hypothetical protein
MQGADLIEALLLLVFVFAALVWRPYLEPRAIRLAEKPIWCFALIAALPVVLRLALLPHHPVPTPDIYDEFGHLFVADTLRHFRLANPTHPMHRFFETFFISQEPTYSSIYPIGQGLVLALSWNLFGLPWAGVLVGAAAFCGLCYWMLRGWVSPQWALLGGVLAVMEFGPLNQWTNNYWGGSVSAAAGCMVFGALPRIKEHGRTRDAVLMGLGLGIHVLTRPFESIFLCIAALTYLPPKFWKPIGIAAAVALPALGITIVQNKAVTGSWTTLPYTLSQQQYGVPAALTFQATPKPNRPLTREQELDYRMQSGFKGTGPETLLKFLLRMEFRIRYYRFYFLPPLYLALIAFLFRLRERRYLWVAAICLLFALGINFFPAFQLHYLAAIVCLFVLISIAGLQRVGPDGARMIVMLCCAHFLFWYGLHVADNSALSRFMLPYETWDGINHRNPERRIAVRDQLAQIPGQLLVFVRYFPQHVFQEEWVFNAADIDNSRIVWARDSGPVENQKLIAYYPKRKALLLVPDAETPELSEYREEAAPAAPPEQKESKEPSKPPSKPLLRFENVK